MRALTSSGAEHDAYTAPGARAQRPGMRLSALHVFARKSSSGRADVTARRGCAAACCHRTPRGARNGLADCAPCGRYRCRDGCGERRRWPPRCCCGRERRLALLVMPCLSSRCDARRQRPGGRAGAAASVSFGLSSSFGLTPLGTAGIEILHSLPRTAFKANGSTIRNHSENRAAYMARTPLELARHHPHHRRASSSSLPPPPPPPPAHAARVPGRGRAPQRRRARARARTCAAPAMAPPKPVGAPPACPPRCWRSCCSASRCARWRRLRACPAPGGRWRTRRTACAPRWTRRLTTRCATLRKCWGLAERSAPSRRRAPRRAAPPRVCACGAAAAAWRAARLVARRLRLPPSRFSHAAVACRCRGRAGAARAAAPPAGPAPPGPALHGGPVHRLARCGIAAAQHALARLPVLSHCRT
jgi:hypothetical protein